MEITRENYYDYPAVSHSSLAFLDPNMGGGPKKFRSYFSGEIEKKDSIHMERGRLLHRFVENPKGFAVSPLSKPSETVCDIIERVFSARTEGEFDLLSEAEDVIVAIARSVGFQRTWGKEAVYADILKKGNDYFEFLKAADGKIIIDDATKHILENQIKNIEPLLAEVESLHGTGWRKFNELPLLFMYKGILFKALIDMAYVNDDKKKIHLYDLKTSSTPISKFMGYNELVGLPDGELLGYQRMAGPFQYYRIYRQMSMYVQALLMHYPGYEINVGIMVAESVGSFDVAKLPVISKYLEAGAKEILGLYDFIAEVNPFPMTLKDAVDQGIPAIGAFAGYESVADKFERDGF